MQSHAPLPGELVEPEPEPVPVRPYDWPAWKGKEALSPWAGAIACVRVDPMPMDFTVSLEWDRPVPILVVNARFARLRGGKVTSQVRLPLARDMEALLAAVREALAVARIEASVSLR